MSRVNTRFADWSEKEDFHTLCASPHPDKETIKRLVKVDPSLAKACNRFGRAPLHYCLDRGKVDKELIKILLDASPEAIYIVDYMEETPLEIALRWHHNTSILYLLLNIDPNQNYKKYLQVKYTYLLGTFLFYIQKHNIVRVESLRIDNHRIRKVIEYNNQFRTCSSKKNTPSSKSNRSSKGDTISSKVLNTDSKPVAVICHSYEDDIRNSLESNDS